MSNVAVSQHVTTTIVAGKSPPRQYRNKHMHDACIAAAQSARRLAHTCRCEAAACLPKNADYREHLESESARHFKRARGYIEWARREIVE